MTDEEWRAYMDSPEMVAKQRADQAEAMAQIPALIAKGVKVGGPSVTFAITPFEMIRVTHGDPDVVERIPHKRGATDGR